MGATTGLCYNQNSCHNQECYKGAAVYWYTEFMPKTNFENKAKVT